ncbi:MAG: L-threonylcarbamoyladenylate synthase [Gammaproteobacteria bacterium]
MAQLIDLHPDNPHSRRVKQVVDILRGGGVVAYPTEMAYAIACCIGQKEALEKLRRVRKLSDNHLLTLMCFDFSQMSEYGHIDNSAFRLMHRQLPGAFTFVLRATRAVPRRVMNPKRKTIGLRLACTPIVNSILCVLGEPMITATLKLPGEQAPLVDPYEIDANLGHQLDAILVGGEMRCEETTVVDMTTGQPEVIRQGAGQLMSC